MPGRAERHRSVAAEDVGPVPVTGHLLDHVMGPHAVRQRVVRQLEEQQVDCIRREQAARSVEDVRLASLDVDLDDRHSLDVVLSAVGVKRRGGDGRSLDGLDCVTTDVDLTGDRACPGLVSRAVADQLDARPRGINRQRIDDHVVKPVQLECPLQGALGTPPRARTRAPSPSGETARANGALKAPMFAPTSKTTSFGSAKAQRKSISRRSK